MAQPVISVRGVSKKYRIGMREQKSDTMLAALVNGIRSPLNNLRRIRNLAKLNDEDDSIFWALRDVSFDVQEGEVLGIIGHNGAGKSTLLKILSRITEPSAGEVHIHGRIAALLEVGTGFHPELTGRENIYMNGTILGMRRKEIDQKLDEIVDFSGVEKHLDTPVKFYSSGMRVRLGFSVAAHLEPEILVIDEVLSVGDAEFQKKCLGKMNAISAKSGKTILFVSHDLAAVSRLCTRAILLNQGMLQMQESTGTVIQEYLSRSSSENASRQIDFSAAKGDKRFVINSIELLNNNFLPIPIAFSGQDVVIRLNYSIHSLGPDPIVLIRIKDKSDKILFLCLSRNSHHGVIKLQPVSGAIHCVIPKLPLLPGAYRIDVVLKYGHEVTFELQDCFKLMVEKGDFFGTGKLNSDMVNGMIIYHEWDIK